MQRIAVYSFLCIFSIGFCYLFCLRSGVFGAKVDWISQHSVLPDYFRQQFYDTGNLFPEFAANIGGGQNIYNFAYYGLYNPVLLPSYLLPFVKMSDYMMAAQLLCLIASVILMYEWLRKRGFQRGICIGMAVYFLLAGPMIFHSYNQIMFVNYMPFLMMGLMGVDRYFENGKKTLSVSIFLMIMTSFYFSIGGMLVLAVYGVHRYLMVCDERGERISCRGFLTEGIRFSIPFVLAVLMSGILLVPTALALTGRGGSGTGLSPADLLIPQISMDRFCYSPYGIGMTTLGVTALTAMLFGRKMHERVLALSCEAVLTIPVFAYLLNGGLYIRDKVMIPFLPLLCYVLACYLESLGKSENSADNRADCRRWGKFIRLCPYMMTIGLIYVSRGHGGVGDYWKPLILDGFVMLIVCCIYTFYQMRSFSSSTGAFWNRNAQTGMFLLVPAIMMLVVFDSVCHEQTDRAVRKDFYEEVTDPAVGELITEVTAKEEGYYRTEQLGNDTENAANLNRIWSMDQYSSSIYSSSYHEGYYKFREETFQLEEPFRNFLMQSAVHNPVYQRFMGVKYVVSKEDVPGYELVEKGEDKHSKGGGYGDESKNGWRVYQNNQVSPAAYGTDKVITEDTYQKLEYPYNQLALLAYAVVKDTGAKGVRKTEGEEEIKKIEKSDYVTPVKLDLPETVRSDTNQKARFALPVPQAEEKGERVLFLRFRVTNLEPEKDVAVWLEGTRNKLTAKNHFYYNANTEFTYTVSLKQDQDSVEIIFGKGEYEIADVEAFVSVLPGSGGGSKDQLYQSEFLMDKKKTKGNCIAGTIDVKEPGYFITTIPYDENFEILADGREVKGEEVNTAFLGFRIDAGEHEIRIVYHAPGLQAGKVMSVAGIALFLFVILAGNKPGGCLHAFGSCRESQRRSPSTPRASMSHPE